MWYFIINIYTIYRRISTIYSRQIGCIMTHFRYFIKFLHFVLEISATTISSGIAFIRTVYQAFCLYLTHLVLKTVSNIVLLVIVFKSCYGIFPFYRRYMMDIIRRNLDFIGKIQLKIRTFSVCLSGITIFDASCL